MSPAPAVTQPHANQLSVSQPVDMHAHAIITAPMTNTKSEPIANLRIQGILSLGVVENERELRREHDRSFHRHVAICRFVQFLTGHPELAFNRAQDSPRKIPEGADGN
jgi:hypothetical protein